MAAVRRRAPLSVRRRSASPPWYKASAEVQALRGYHTGVGQCALSAVSIPLAPSRPTDLAKRRTEITWPDLTAAADPTARHTHTGVLFRRVLPCDL